LIRGKGTLKKGDKVVRCQRCDGIIGQLALDPIIQDGLQTTRKRFECEPGATGDCVGAN